MRSRIKNDKHKCESQVSHQSEAPEAIRAEEDESFGPGLGGQDLHYTANALQCGGLWWCGVVWGGGISISKEKISLNSNTG